MRRYVFPPPGVFASALAMLALAFGVAVAALAPEKPAIAVIVVVSLAGLLLFAGEIGAIRQDQHDRLTTSHIMRRHLSAATIDRDDELERRFFREAENLDRLTRNYNVRKMIQEHPPQGVPPPEPYALMALGIEVVNDYKDHHESEILFILRALVRRNLLVPDDDLYHKATTVQSVEDVNDLSAELWNLYNKMAEGRNNGE